MALDQGTTSSRAIVFDRRGLPVASHQQEFRQIYPQPGWVEHDPQDLWRTQLACAQAALKAAGIAARDLAAIGIANQRETTLLWERASGAALGPAIVWQDRRTAAVCATLRAQGREAQVAAATGLLLDPYFSGTKLAWLLDHVPGARARAERGELAFGTVDSWLLWQLTGGAVHATDVSNASRTLLLNLHTLTWDDELLALFNVPRAVLPQVVPSSALLGQTRADLLGAPVPITGIAGDQQAATFGQACFAAGMAKNTYGTGCFMLMNVGAAPQPSANRLLATALWQRAGAPAAYALEGSVFVGGAVVQWLRDGLQLFGRAEEVEALAAQVPDSGGVMLVPAFTGLGAPYWDAQARGLMIGMTRGTTKAHVARAALESIALQSADVLAAMQKDAQQPITQLRADGGAARNDLLMQMQADLSGVPVVRPRVTETTALGAAYLAGLATGVWASQEEIAALWQVDRRFEPAIDEDARAERLTRWQRAVQRAREWA
ncbi:MAG: glycerol kinase GlpK [Burkholderiales bacterium]|jgi:glycerol kinase|nr:glycerol kinase GlpK [Burkholderiales bacterium]MCA3227710.1 glycerol kinase GlpK [Burkholderiales bacterium]